MLRRQLSAIFENGGRNLNKSALVVCVVIVASIGCKPPTQDERLDDVRSWLATADMAAQAWLNHTTPEKYTRQTLELSGKNIRQSADELLKSVPAGLEGGSLDSLLTRSDERVDRMAGLVASRNSPQLRIELDSLRADEKSVQEIAERVKSKQ